MPAMQTITVRRRGAAAIVALDRPDTLNAWNRRLAVELRDALADAAADDAVRAVCVTGAGRGFSSGVDLRDSGARTTADGHLALGALLAEQCNPIIVAIRRMPKPVVAAVNGAAVGIGCSLALAADLVVAKESAFFQLAFANVGLVPDGGSSSFVPQRVGFARAAEMALLGERVDARAAVEQGLINRAVPDEDFEAEVEALVDRLAAGPTRAYAAIKRQLNAWAYGRLEEQLGLEAALQQEMSASADFAEGVAAFVAKRPASFRGT
jgi:2-(1,2-epoxy-1,2-dihydrophenyl)acetyl-CoA isomerase